MISYLPNILTILRILIVPVFIWVVITPDFTYRVIGVLLFMVATATDFIDGKLARRLNATSEFGKFMDPFADKLLVISSLFALLYLEDLIELWMVLVIIARDLLITIMRGLAIRKGTRIRTSQLGKLKTVFQMMSIFILFVIISFRTHPENVVIRANFQEAQEKGISNWNIVFQAFTSPEYTDWLVGIPYSLMFLTTLFTIISGLRYLVTNYRLFLPSKDPKPASGSKVNEIQKNP